MSDGIDITLRDLESRDESHASTSVNLKLFSTGYTTAPYHWVQIGESRKRIRLHAAVAIIEHPEFGVTSFDTGYSPRFYEATSRWPYRLIAKTTPVITSEDRSAVTMLARMGIDSDKSGLVLGSHSQTVRRHGVPPQNSAVRRILVSHFHCDHICGLADFPDAEVIAMRPAWESVRNARGIQAVRRAIAPGLIPPDLNGRLHLFDRFLGPGFGPFERSQDLFGDGSVRLIELPGHAVGQFGIILQTGPDERKFLVADSVWTGPTIEQDLKLPWRFQAIAADRVAARETREKLIEFHRCFPEIEIIPTHCPAIAAAWGFDD